MAETGRTEGMAGVGRHPIDPRRHPIPPLGLQPIHDPAAACALVYEPVLVPVEAVERGIDPSAVGAHSAGIFDRVHLQREADYRAYLDWPRSVDETSEPGPRGEVVSPSSARRAQAPWRAGWRRRNVAVSPDPVTISPLWTHSHTRSSARISPRRGSGRRRGSRRRHSPAPAAARAGPTSECFPPSPCVSA